MSNQDWLDVTLTNIVRPMVGPRCKIKDTDDFPELKHTGSRCLVCTTYEEIDAAKQIITTKIVEARLEELKYCSYMAFGTVQELIDERIAELEAALKEDKWIK